MSDDPREVLAYLRQRGRTGLRVDHTGDDITDALTLRLWLWWEGEATELWLLEAAEALRRNRRAVGASLGLTTGQSLVNRITNLHAKMDRKRLAANRPVAATSWDEQIRAVAASLAGHRREMPEDVADDMPLDVLTSALPRWQLGAPPPDEGVLNALRFLLGDLADVAPAGSELRLLVDRGIELVGMRKV